ncbi:putative pyrimidine kinase [Escherichia coli]|nr:putative pyrimidine kinase [Escherichia coli]
MREKDYVVIIGSANIDVAGYSHESLIMRIQIQVK